MTRRLLRGTLALSLAFLAACGATPSERWGAATIVYTQTNNTMASLADAGVVDLPTAERYESVRAPVGAALDATHASLIAGDAPAAESWLEQVADGLDLMQGIVKEAQP